MVLYLYILKIRNICYLCHDLNTLFSFKGMAVHLMKITKLLCHILFPLSLYSLYAIYDYAHMIST